MSCTLRTIRAFPTLSKKQESLKVLSFRGGEIIRSKNHYKGSKYTSTIMSAGKPNEAKTAMDETVKGAFQRTESKFRNFISSDNGSIYKPATGRYHLIISFACPWACRCLAMIKLKGLDDVIGVTVVDPIFAKTRPDDKEDTHHGWAFNENEQVEGAKTVREFYEMCDPTLNKFVVPILYDTLRKEIVNNESSEIIRMFGKEMNAFATRNKEWDLYPESIKNQIDTVNEWIYPQINNGVYRSGFATSQGAYDVAVKDVFDGLDRVEDILSKQRYIASPDAFTEADIRLFVTLVRFDEVYVGHFKCNKKCLREYHHITNYVREIYQIPGIADTVNMHHIKEHYHRSHPTINKFGIVPIGSDSEVDFSKPHNRDDLFPLENKSIV